MPRMSKESAPTTEDFGPALDHSGQLDDYTVDFVTIREGHSLAALLQGLPGDSCPCLHWGYIFTGKITVTYADRVEVCLAGEAFLMSPGHVPAAETGTEFVQFSPTDQLNRVQAHMATRAMALQAEPIAPAQA